jgi:hypothetical protein
MKIEGRDKIRQGMVNFLGLSRHAHIVITKRIAVANLVVLDQDVSFEEKQEDNSWKPQSRNQVTIFEFEGARIRRIADYWSREAAPTPLDRPAGCIRSLISLGIG